MRKTDTSAEAVDRLARSLSFVANRTGMTVERCEKITGDAAVTLRALAAKRDALKARAEAAEAEVARLRDALTACARGDLTAIEKGRIARAALRELRQ